MALLGTNLTVLIGKTLPRPIPKFLLEELESVEVTQSDDGKSGFQIVFRVGRAGNKDSKDYQMIKSPLLEVFNRVILVVTIGAKPQVLMDGMITNRELSPNVRPGDSTFTITGEDISIMMDLEEKTQTYVAQDEVTIARKIILQYAKYGLKPNIINPRLKNRPTRNSWIPLQSNKTDFSYLQYIGKRYGFVFYVTPGPATGINTAYWGPPKQQSQPQDPLTVNMGPFSNVESINLQYDGLSATKVKASVQDRKTNKIRKIKESESDRRRLAKKSALSSQSAVRSRRFCQTGVDTKEADAYIQGMVDSSVDNVITATGEIDVVRYGTPLGLRRLVVLRGVGITYDGLYYVKNVTHKLQQGSYKQDFTLTREGLIST
ncbi:hypothetical protein [Crocosphaera sp.]|uniref:phage late control D family protein n=1 Tax=Crocosphaera sp. TaxID=2729996 RepID=UPI00261B1D6A|nr:hypothetical protein [Crocosphaera sp.]MDJ0579913.1 hypothetical protein [Crocosphaera sp.]